MAEPVPPFRVDRAHNDWYEDGTDGGDENLWRLDFMGGDGDDNEYQAQLFATAVAPDADDLEYTAFRLFLERDNRHPDGSGLRVDYACGAWPLTAERALALLAAGEREAVRMMAAEVAHVAALPNDRAFIRESLGRRGRERLTAETYWAEVDARTKPGGGRV